MKCEDIRAAVFNAESGRQTAGEKLTQAVMTYIETHYLEKFSLKRMTGDLYVNGSYLLRVFRKQTGCTPLAYHHQIRCERAKELLRDTRDPVAEIGETVGFASPAHFTHVFKKLEGCTPTEYRTQRYRYRRGAGCDQAFRERGDEKTAGKRIYHHGRG